MRPLPTDRATDRAETVAYLTLGLAGLVALLLALPTSVGFGNAIDPVTARLQREARPADVRFAADDAGVGTNLTGPDLRSAPVGVINVTNPALAVPRGGGQNGIKTAI
jgi:hypothetical protein